MSIGTGFYHFYDDERPLSPLEIEALAEKMRELVARDIGIHIEEWSWSSAMRYFGESGQDDTLLLLEHMNDPRILLNECAGFRDLHMVPLVPSMGVLATWELVSYHRGFLLRYPLRENPDRLTPFVDEPMLYAIASENRERGRVLGVASVGALNRVVESREIKDYIAVAETLQNKKLAAIADGIAARSDTVKIVLIAGPSSSGKTTTSKKLAIQLKVMGYAPVTLGLDNYFVDRNATPLDADGKPDYECLAALDIDFLDDQIRRLLAGEKVELPEFDFKTGRRKSSGKIVSLSDSQILVLEGIHALDDALIPHLAREAKFKIYVSALTQLNLDDHNRISTTDYRLLRRLVRDCIFRSHSARMTLALWDSVQRGERKFIFPFQNGADAVLNTALDYELGVLKVYAEPQLRTVKPMDAEYAEARRIQGFLDYFSPIPAQYVPRDSILREFIGESEFKY
jgi:uridine kinase